jgi:hypothetical protein
MVDNMNNKKTDGSEVESHIAFDIFMFLIPLPFLFLLNFYYAGIFMPVPYRSLAPFYGKVIDADTKEPIPDVVVLAVYELTRYTLAGEVGYIVDGQETLTDKNGEFRLNRTRRWFVFRRGYPEGEIEIFKPGYGTLYHERSKALGDNINLPTPNKYIVYEIPKLKTPSERQSNIFGSYDEVSYENRKFFMEAINKDRLDLGFSPLTLPEKEHKQSIGQLYRYGMP